MDVINQNRTGGVYAVSAVENMYEKKWRIGHNWHLLEVKEVASNLACGKDRK